MSVSTPVELERPQLTLVGTIAGDHESFGIFIDQSGEVILLKTGQSHNGWVLRRHNRAYGVPWTPPAADCHGGRQSICIRGPTVPRLAYARLKKVSTYSSGLAPILAGTMKKAGSVFPGKRTAPEAVSFLSSSMLPKPRASPGQVETHAGCFP